MEDTISFRAIIEVLGKPKDHVETMISSLVNQIKSLKDYKVTESFISEPKDQEHLFSIFAELEIQTKDFSKLYGFCFDFMPSSIEIISPENLHISASEMSGMLTDLQGKLHEGDMVSKKLNSVNFFLRRNMNSLMKNYVILVLKGGKKDLASISKFTGIAEPDLKEFIDVMVSENIIKKSDNFYELK